jgi:hypothetical protein
MSATTAVAFPYLSPIAAVHIASKAHRVGIVTNKGNSPIRTVNTVNMEPKNRRRMSIRNALSFCILLPFHFQIAAFTAGEPVLVLGQMDSAAALRA